MMLAFLDRRRPRRQNDVKLSALVQAETVLPAGTPAVQA